MTLSEDTPLERVGIVMTSTIGNAIHVLPVVNALKRSYPGVRVSWIAQQGPESLLRGHPAVDEFIVVDRSRGWSALPALHRTLARKPFEVVLDFQVSFKAGLVTRLARAPVKVGFDWARTKDLNWLFTTHRIPPRPVGHVQDMFLEFLEYLGLPREPLEWRLGPWDHERDLQRRFFSGLERPVVSLAIGATRQERDWLPERWSKLADALYSDFGMQPVLVGGRSPRERETERHILERARHPLVSTLGIPLRELVGVLDGSALVISVDTGPMHMAVALGRPVIALLGFSNPKKTGPYRFRELAVDAFGDPGEDYPASAARRPGRMGRITVEQVLERVGRARATYALDGVGLDD